VTIGHPRRARARVRPGQLPGGQRRADGGPARSRVV